MLKNKILLVALLLLPQLAMLQTLKKVKREADAAFAAENFPVALAYAEEVIKAEETNWQYHYQAAKSAYELRAYPKTIDLAQQILEEQSAAELHPKTNLLLAQTNLYLGNYAEARRLAELASGLDSEQDQAIIDQIFANTNWAEVAINECDPDVSIPETYTPINTFKSDFPIAIRNNNLQYASFVIDTIGKWCNCNDLCNFKMSWGRHITSENRRDSFNFPNYPQNLGHFTYAGDNHRVYYSLVDCNDSGELTHSIYYMEQTGTTWADPQKLPESINVPGASAKQPFLASHPEGETDTLFYVSNRPGGQGGWDIWYTEIKEDRFAVSKNLEIVNTAGDEITPFYHTPSATLFFSTNQSPNSFGGMDIFKLEMDGFGTLTPQNMGCPINSSFDDTYFITNSTGDVSYFASNRDGVQYDETYPDFKNCCPDIFEIKTPPLQKRIDLIVRAFNAVTQEPLSGVSFETSASTTGALNPFSPPTNEAFYANVPINDLLSSTGSLEGYRPANSEINSVLETGKSRDTVYLDLNLVPIITLNVEVRDAITKEPIDYEAIVELFNRTEGSTPEIRSLAAGEPRTSFELEPVSTYEAATLKSDDNTYISPQGSKSLTTGSEPFDTSIVLFLFNPLPLYFDHDQPGPQSPVVETSYEDYGSAFTKYVARADIFASRSCNVGEEPGVNDFFFDVKAAKDRLDFLAETLIERLSSPYENIESITITFEGSASSSGQSTYNAALSARRIDSVKKYLRICFKDHLDLFEKLNIEDLPKGSGNADQAACIRGAADYRCCSRYGITSSRDRKVEIIDIEIKKINQ